MAINASYAERCAEWVAQQLDERNTEALLDYQQQHVDALQAQPRDEHLLPLFTALGAAGLGPVLGRCTGASAIP